MKEIILDCFKADESCSVISLDKNLLLNNPKAQEFSVLVFNHSLADCQLLTTVRGQEQVDLAKFLKQLTQSPTIAAGQSRKYFFDFDFLSLAMEHRELVAKFDLVFDFSCAEVAKTVATAPLQSITQGSVLAASNSLAPVQVLSASPAVANQQFRFSAFFYFLSSLFILVFFVIIKVANGKKRKSQG